MQEGCYTTYGDKAQPQEVYTPPYDTYECFDEDDSARGLTVASVVVGTGSQDQDTNCVRD